MIETFLDQLFAARFDEVLQRCVDGQPLILKNRRPETLGRLLDQARTGRLSLEIVSITDTSGLAPEILIRTAASVGADVVTLREFRGAPELRYCLFVAEPPRQSYDDWRNLAGALASIASTAAAEEGPALVVVGDFSDAPPAGCQMLDDGGLVGPIEAMFFAGTSHHRLSLLEEAADAAAVEASRGDLQILDKLLRLPNSERFEMIGWARRQPVGEANPLPWRGKEESCPIWLALQDQARLRHRVWRGQVGVLFPWLEEARQEFLEKHGRKIPTGARDKETGEEIPVREYEWAHIAWVLRLVRRELADAAGCLRVVRNELAHGRPISWNEAVKVQQSVSRLQAWSTF